MVKSTRVTKELKYSRSRNFTNQEIREYVQFKYCFEQSAFLNSKEILMAREGENISTKEKRVHL